MVIRVLFGAVAIGMIAPSWAAQGTWVSQLPRQTIVVSQRPLESAPVQPPQAMAGAEIGRVRWKFHTEAPEPTLKVWLCQSQFCLPLTRSRGETQRFSGRSASIPFRLRFQWPPGKHKARELVVSGGQLIVDYQSDAGKQRK